MKPARLFLTMFGPGGIRQYWSGNGHARPLRLHRDGGRVVEEPDAPEPRQAALWQHPGVPGRWADHQ
jgi:hypothetical protein